MHDGQNSLPVGTVNWDGWGASKLGRHNLCVFNLLTGASCPRAPKVRQPLLESVHSSFEFNLTLNWGTVLPDHRVVVYLLHFVMTEILQKKLPCKNIVGMCIMNTSKLWSLLGVFAWRYSMIVFLFTVPHNSRYRVCQHELSSFFFEDFINSGPYNAFGLFMLWVCISLNVQMAFFGLICLCIFGHI